MLEWMLRRLLYNFCRRMRRHLWKLGDHGGNCLGRVKAKGRKNHVPALQTSWLEEVVVDVVFEIVVGVLEVVLLEVAGVLEVVVLEVTGVLEVVDRGVCAMQEHALESLLGGQLAGTNDGPSEVRVPIV